MEIYKWKKFCDFFLAATFMICAGLGTLFLTNLNSVHAETVADYEKLEVDELPGFAHDSVSIIPSGTKSNVMFSVPNGGRIGFNGGFKNVEITSTINFSTIGNTTFILRAQGDTVLPAGHGGWTNKGYYLRWYGGSGKYDFVKNDTVIAEAQWGPLPPTVINTDYEVKFKAVDNGDGTANVSVLINGASFVNWVDVSDTLDAGWFAICSEGSVFTVKGNGLKQEPIKLNDVCSPITSANFPATINADGSVNTNKDGLASGAGYVFQTTSSYSVKTKFTPSEFASDTSAFRITVGAQKTNANEMNRPEIVDAAWGWSEPGYTISLAQNGQRHLLRGATLLNYAWSGPTLTSGTTYEIEFGYYPVGNNSNLIYFMLNNVLQMVFIDRKTDDYTPVMPNTVGAQPAGLLNYALTLGYGCAGTFTPYEKTTYTTKTLITSDLGTPSTIGGAGVFDRNNSVKSFVGGIVAGYQEATQNESIKFKANFSTIGANIVFTTRAQGSLDTPWGGGWTNKGYAVYLYPNGQLILVKNGITLCEGWATGGFGFAANTDYIIEILTVNISENIVRFSVFVNDVCVANYIDTVNTINEAGIFAVYSSNMEGSLKPSGVNVPTVNVAQSVKANQNVQLDYSVTGKDEGDEVTYYVDTTNSTATATINSNTLTATTSGNLVVYACVNGIYSDDVLVTVEEPLKAEVTNIPLSPIIVGGEKFSVSGKLSDSSVTVTSKVFSVENGTGKATINAETGEITAVQAGSVYVFVTINEIKSQGYLISISPKIEVKNTSALAVGETRELDYFANCVLPTENIIINYELVSGSQLADLNSTTGVIKAKALGIVTLRVTLTGQTFQAVSEIVSVPIENPVVVLLGVKDMVKGETLTVTPQFSDNKNIKVETSKIEILEGDNLVTVDGNNIRAVKGGIVKLRAVINGVASKNHFITITELTPTLVVANRLPTNETVTLSVNFNSNFYTPSNIVYSIVSGGNLATINNNVLTTLSKAGKIKIKANIDNNLYVAEQTIDIYDCATITGLPNDNRVYVGTSTPISFVYNGTQEITSVKFELVSGGNIATLTELELGANETLRDKKATLKINDSGTIKIKITINNSIVIEKTVNAVVQKDLVPSAEKDLVLVIGLILGGMVLLIIAIFVTIFFVTRKNRKAKKDK